MSLNSDKFNAKSGDMTRVTPQCKNCSNYLGPLQCDKGIKPGSDVLLNKIKCRGYKEK